MPSHDDSNRGPSAESASGRGSDSVFDLLADPRRRALLEALETAGGTATVEELAETIARRESDAHRRAISDHGGVRSSDLERIRISLHHAHVPRLEEANAVAYEGGERTVTLLDRGRGLLERMDAIRFDPLER